MRKIPGRMGRRLFSFTALLSLLLCITALVFWNASSEKSARSWGQLRRRMVGHVEFTNQSNRLRIRVFTNDQMLYQKWFDDQASTLDNFDWEAMSFKAQLKNLPPNSKAYRSVLSVPIAAYDITVPLRVVTALTAALPVEWMALWWRRNRQRVRAMGSRYIRWEPASELIWPERARRKLFMALAGLCLSLTLITAFLWVRSYLASDRYSVVEFANGQLGSRSKVVDFATHRGGLALAEAYYAGVPGPAGWPTSTSPADYYLWQTDRGRLEPPRIHKLPPASVPGKAANSYGVHYQQLRVPAVHGYLLVVPFWFISLCCAVVPTIWLLIYWRRAAKPGHCPACDYDLTANTSGVCPECGRAVRVIAATEAG